MGPSRCVGKGSGATVGRILERPFERVEIVHGELILNDASYMSSTVWLGPCSDGRRHVTLLGCRFPAPRVNA